MTEQEIRALVRDAIARHGAGIHVRLLPDPKISPDPLSASHALFDVPSGAEACIIEPSVPCTHCGYCKSYGH